MSFKKLEERFKKQGDIKSPGGLAASIMHKKYKEKDIKNAQKNHHSMANVTPKKKYG